MAYFDKYGVEFSDDRKTLIKCPEDFQGEYIVPEETETINGDFAGVLEFTAKAHFDDVKLPEDIPLLEREFAKMIYEVLYEKDEESEVERLKKEVQSALIQRNDFEAMYVRYKQKYEKLMKNKKVSKQTT